MLSGETRGAGGGGLARHLLSEKLGQAVERIAGRFLAAQTLAEQVREIVVGARHGRTKKAVWHVHVDPPPGFDTRQGIGVFLKHLEHEFRLEDQARTGVLHSGKDGKERLHAHVVYSLVRDDGRVVDLKNSYRRREKCAVLTAFDLGLPPPPIPKPRSIYTALMREGRADVGEWMSKHFDFRDPIRIAEVSPARRDIANRTGILVADIRTALADAWPPSNPSRFVAALHISGLTLAQGEKAVVVVDSSGTAHPLARELRAAIRAAGGKSPTATDVRKALTGLYLPSLAHLKEKQNARSTEAAPDPDRDSTDTQRRESSASTLGPSGGARGRGEPDRPAPGFAQRDRDLDGTPGPSARPDRGGVIRLAAALNSIDLVALRRRIVIAAKRTVLARGLRERIAIQRFKNFSFAILRARLDNLILQKDHNMNPKTYEPGKQDYKTTLLEKLAGNRIASGFGASVHMVKKLGPQSYRLLMHDGSWVEVDKDSGKIVLFGRQGESAAVAAAIINEHPNFVVEELKKTGGTSAQSAATPTKEAKQKLLSENEINKMAEGWRKLGYDDLEFMQNCVIVNLGQCKFYDYGDHVTVMGPVSDEAVFALVRHAKEAWGGHKLTGPWSERDKERIWLESQRQGTTLSDYQPSKRLVAQWEAEKAKLKSSAPANATTMPAGPTALDTLESEAMSWRTSLDELRRMRESADENRDEERLAFIMPAIEEMEWKVELNAMAIDLAETDPNLSYADALAHAQQRMIAAKAYDRPHSGGGYPR